MKKIFVFLLIVAGLSGFRQSDPRHITGHVFAKDDGLPVPGVSVRIKGNNSSVQTDTNGAYSINVPNASDILVYSAIGYTAQEIKIKDRNVIDVYLEASTTTLNEVVVTQPMNIQTQSAQLGYATATVDNKNLTEIRADKALRGKVSGVRVTSANGASANYIPPAASGDESYKGISENGFETTKSSPLSTFSVDVDAASYSNVRRFINNGELPPADAVRIEEMINYFKYDLKGPANNDPVAIHTELSSAPWNAKHRLLRIGLKAKTISTDKLPPSNLVFLIDVSGSMGQPNKLPLVKASMKLLTEQLRAEDRVGIVTYAGQAGVALGSTPGNEKLKIMEAIEALEAGGSTNGGEGIKMAYRIARDNFFEKGNNRIIMATDGDFNVGPNSDEDMEHLIVRERESRVAISIMGFGMGNLKDSKMETMADKGNGNYAYIDNITEANKALVSEFAGTLYTVAKDVKIQVEFNPSKVQAYRLLGYEDRMLNKEDFNNDRKDAGDMGSGHTVTALYEIVPAGLKDDYAGSVDPLKYQKPEPVPSGSGSDEMATIKFRYKPADTSPSKMEQVVVKDTPVAFNSSSADFRFAAAVAEFGMLLRDSQNKGQSTFDQDISIARAAKGEDADGYRSEFVRLAESAKLLAKTSLAAY
ncbi:MAG TPA: von Willebrand factor type A domain-containing protein [Mucilaginibacter sp.]|jgi:Ca-activated chloride channel family protein|nr:von Willebrand factor type A domain-containing protein [Mucilaginibacter sp.]